MKRFVILSLLVVLSGSALAKTHRDMFNVPCSVLWPAVKDTLRNSGKYGIIGIDNTEMTASYKIGGFVGGERLNALVLNSKGESACEMQVQTMYSGLIHNDEGDLKKRVEESLAKLEASKGSAPGKSDTPGSQPPATAGSGAQTAQATASPKR